MSKHMSECVSSERASELVHVSASVFVGHCALRLTECPASERTQCMGEKKKRSQLVPTGRRFGMACMCSQVEQALSGGNGP